MTNFRIAAPVAMLAAVVLQVSAMAQTGPEFEVASIKPSGPEDRAIGMFTHPGGRIVCTNCTLAYLIEVAFQVEAYQVDGGPGWIYNRRFTLQAQPPAESESARLNPPNIKLPPPAEELAMLRNLLAERFSLRIREEGREGAVLALELADGGPRLDPAKDPEEFPVVAFGVTGNPEHPNFMQGHNASMERFADRLSAFLERPVVDRTGLAGTFDFRFEYAQDPTRSSGPALVTAIQDLGLRVVPARATIPYLVVEHAEEPSEN